MQEHLIITMMHPQFSPGKLQPLQKTKIFNLLSLFWPDLAYVKAARDWPKANNIAFVSKPVNLFNVSQARATESF